MSVMKNLVMTGAVLASVVAFAAPGIAQTQGREVIHSFNVSDDSLVFRVPTGGCTTEQSFRVDVQRSRQTANVSLVRTVPDDCKGFFVDGTEVSYPLNRIGVNPGDTIQVRNRFGSGLLSPSRL
jgi:hypothetical protein